MPLDPSIALQSQVPNSVNVLSGFIDLGRKKLELDKSRETYNSDVSQAKAQSSSASSKAIVDAANVNPLIAQQAATTQQAQTQATRGKYELTRDQGMAALQQAGGLLQDPAIVQGDPLGSVKAVISAKQRAIDMGVPPEQAEVMFGRLVTQAHDDPKALAQTLKNLVVGGQSAPQQAGTLNPNTSFVPTAGGTQPYNTNIFSPGGPGPQGSPMAPPNQVITNPNTGGLGRVNPATGAGFSDTSPPPGETIETGKRYTQERNDARAAANAAPTLHNINQSIMQEVDKGLSTGKLGELIQKVSSATGFNLGAGQATDYNTLGKMLERSALTAAQGMGPHTNAGLEAQVRANGSLDYTPQAIRKIANLNDALVTGATLYSAGLENAMTMQGQYSKPTFDKAWAAAMNPSNGVDGIQALRLKNAVDNGDTKEVQKLVKEVGGPGSKGANALRAKLGELQRLSQ